MKEGDSNKSIFITLFANLLIAAAKLIGAIITLSGSMLAEAIHTFSDCANQGLLLYGIKRSNKAPDREHPLGYGKAVYFWSFIVALMLFSMGGLFSAYEGIHKMLEPKPLESPVLAVGILLFALILEAFSLWTAIKEIRSAGYKGRLYHWFKSSKQSDLMIIFGENLSAVIGLVAAISAILLAMLTGNPFYDGLGSLVIGLLLIIIALGMGKEIKSLLIGESAGAELENKLRDYLLTQDSVEQVLEILTIIRGKDIMAALKCKMKNTGTIYDLAQKINFIEKELKAQNPALKWIFFEPDVE